MATTLPLELQQQAEAWLCEGQAYRGALHVLQNMEQQGTFDMGNGGSNIGFDTNEELFSIELEDGIAYVPVHGILMPRQNLFSSMYASTTLDWLNVMLGRLLLNDEVRAIVLEIDSPGGMASGIPEMANMIADMAQHKLIVASCTKALSAAYWLAAATTAVGATSEGSEFGSIGAVLEVVDRTARNAMEGERVTVFSTGALKVSGHESVPLTPTQRTYLEGRVMDLGLLFFGALMKFRPGIRGRAGSENLRMNELALGKVYFAAEAAELHLHDGVKSASDLHTTLLRSI